MVSLYRSWLPLPENPYDYYAEKQTVQLEDAIEDSEF